KMAQNKIIDKARRRPGKKPTGEHEREERPESLDAVADRVATPSRVAAGRELLELVWRRLSTEDRYLAEQRADGKEWAELGEELDRKPDALRKQLTRALDVVGNDLSISDLLAQRKT